MQRGGQSFGLARFAFLLGVLGLLLASILLFGINYMGAHLEAEGTQLAQKMHRRDAKSLPPDSEEETPAPSTSPDAVPTPAATPSPAASPNPEKRMPLVVTPATGDLSPGQAARMAAVRTIGSLKLVFGYLIITGAIWLIDTLIGADVRRRKR